MELDSEMIEVMKELVKTQGHMAELVGNYQRANNKKMDALLKLMRTLAEEMILMKEQLNRGEDK